MQHQQSPEDRFATPVSTSPPWGEHQQRADGPGESSLTRRRREANRLAAQRFRSRKKGYQDSLEERVRVLENEKHELEEQLITASSASVPSQDIKPTAFDAAAHEANAELRAENARLKAELEESRREANMWREEASGSRGSSHSTQHFGSWQSDNTQSGSQQNSHKRRRTPTSQGSLVSSPVSVCIYNAISLLTITQHEITPPLQLPTPQEHPLTRRPQLHALDIPSTLHRSAALPSPSTFLSSHSHSSDSFKLAPLRLPPSPKLTSPGVPSPKISHASGFEILLAVGQEITKEGIVAGGEAQGLGLRRKI